MYRYCLPRTSVDSFASAVQTDFLVDDMLLVFNLGILYRLCLRAEQYLSQNWPFSVLPSKLNLTRTIIGKLYNHSLQGLKFP